MTAGPKKPKPPTGPQLQLLNFVQHYGAVRKLGGGWWTCERGPDYDRLRSFPPDNATWWVTGTVKACITRGWLGVHPDEPTPSDPKYTAMRYTLTPAGREVLADHHHTLEKLP